MVDLEKKAIEYQNQFKVYNKACNYLFNRGFIDKVKRSTIIKDFQLGLSLSKNDYYYGYLVFPIYDKKNNIVSFTGRSIMDGITPLHKHWYGTIDYFYNHKILQYNDLILITESPLDALSLRYAGFHSIATMGSARLPTKYTDLKDQQVIIFFDTDLNNVGQSKAKLLASKINSICRTIQIGEIPLPEGRKKIDINDLLKEKIENFEYLIGKMIAKAIEYVYEEPIKINYTSNHDFSNYDIISIMSNHIDLIQIGNLYRAHCPFHNDSDPSFTVYPETSSYYCWGCEKGGDIISFLQELMGYEFMEAKKYLETNYG